MTYCPCGTGKIYMNCCGTFLENNKIPATPEELMRSRYTAYTKANIDYIVKTMKKPASEYFHPETALQWAKQVRWEKCDVLRSSCHENDGFVEFIAHFSENGVKKTIHEKSEFHKIQGQWFYVNGNALPTKQYQINRNDLCPCGSQKKYKKCCLFK